MQEQAWGDAEASVGPSGWEGTSRKGTEEFTGLLGQDSGERLRLQIEIRVSFWCSNEKLR